MARNLINGRSRISSRFLIRGFTTSLLAGSSTFQIACGSDSSLKLSVFTMCAWIKVSGSGNRAIIGRTVNNGPEFRIDSANTLSLLKQNTANIGTTTQKIIANTWIHVAVSYDSLGNYAFYINGQPAIGGTGTNLQTFSISGTFTIGTGANGVERFAGNIDEIIVYNTVLSSTDILNIYLSGNPLTNVAGYWKLNEGSGTTATDSSGNGNTGTISDGTYSTDVAFKNRTISSGRGRIN